MCMPASCSSGPCMCGKYLRFSFKSLSAHGALVRVNLCLVADMRRIAGQMHAVITAHRAHGQNLAYCNHITESPIACTLHLQHGENRQPIPISTLCAQGQNKCTVRAAC